MPRATVDHVDHIIEQWSRERPDLDVSPMSIMARISRLSRLVERTIEDVLDAYGINRSQFGVLAALRRAGPPYRLSPTELYNSLLVSSGAVTNRLERLTALGLVERVPEPTDRRSMLVALTPRGRRLIDKAVAAHVANEQRLLSALTPSQKETLAILLRKILLELEDHPPATSGDDGAPVIAPSSRRRPAPARR